MPAEPKHPYYSEVAYEIKSDLKRWRGVYVAPPPRVGVHSINTSPLNLKQSVYVSVQPRAGPDLIRTPPSQNVLLAHKSS